jgi:hypothetical protein
MLYVLFFSNFSIYMFFKNIFSSYFIFIKLFCCMIFITIYYYYCFHHILDFYYGLVVHGCYYQVDVELYYHDFFFSCILETYRVCYVIQIMFDVFKLFFYLFLNFLAFYFVFFAFLSSFSFLISFSSSFLIVFLNLRCHYENIYNFIKIGGIVINYVIILCWVYF